jgi:D-amino peptidase
MVEDRRWRQPPSFIFHQKFKEKIMKVFISTDIEGITSVTHRDETNLDKAMSAAACEDALESGASGILIKDAHGRARNIIPSKLPHEVRLIRGWAPPHPLMMIQGLVETFQAAALIGYRSRARANTRPLAMNRKGMLS